jgi:hypothetical protein
MRYACEGIAHYEGEYKVVKAVKQDIYQSNKGAKLKALRSIMK